MIPFIVAATTVILMIWFIGGALILQTDCCANENDLAPNQTNLSRIGRISFFRRRKIRQDIAKTNKSIARVKAELKRLENDLPVDPDDDTRHYYHLQKDALEQELRDLSAQRDALYDWLNQNGSLGNVTMRTMLGNKHRPCANDIDIVLANKRAFQVGNSQVRTGIMRLYESNVEDTALSSVSELSFAEKQPLLNISSR